ncbi:hypothetical protein EVAR_87059_1 [Eumeta japonica]|uniref:Uncharacterized protein n=1 Tax=Eumeta variegata TaxID=151549 RepID=A0A4C1VNX1_EUMVA|nr:hypothetical protein EVAR_87059_1 [Eumeta japonica]
MTIAPVAFRCTMSARPAIYRWCLHGTVTFATVIAHDMRAPPSLAVAVTFCATLEAIDMSGFLSDRSLATDVWEPRN